MRHHRERVFETLEEVQRLLDWTKECTRLSPSLVQFLGVPPPPEHMSPEMVVVMAKLLVLTMLGGTYGDDMVVERIKYGEDLVRKASLQGLHPFFARANIDDHDLYIFQQAANMYHIFLLEHPCFTRAAMQASLDIRRIQSASKKAHKKPIGTSRGDKEKPVVKAPRPNKKKAQRRESSCKAPACANVYRLLWQSAIRRQVKLNRRDREATAKNIVERVRREKVRAKANADKAARVEAPLSTKGPSGPAPKKSSVHKEAPTAADRAKCESQKCESLRACEAHAQLKKELESLRVAQNEKRLEALSIASSIQNGN